MQKTWYSFRNWSWDHGGKGILGCVVQCKCFVTEAWTWQGQDPLLMQWSHKWVICPKRTKWRSLHQARGHIFLIPYTLYRETILDVFIECLTTFIGIVFHFSQLLSQTPSVSWGSMFMPQGKRKIITKEVLKPLGLDIRNRFLCSILFNDLQVIYWAAIKML